MTVNGRRFQVREEEYREANSAQERFLKAWQEDKAARIRQAEEEISNLEAQPFSADTVCLGTGLDKRFDPPRPCQECERWRLQQQIDRARRVAGMRERLAALQSLQPQIPKEQRLSHADMKVGGAGVLQNITILQVLGPSDMLVIANSFKDEGNCVWVHGWDTLGLVDGKQLRQSRRAMVIGTTSYETAQGSTRTTYVVVPCETIAAAFERR